MKKWIKRMLYGFLALILLGLLTLGYAYFIEPNRLVVNEYEIKIKDWNKTFDGLKIVAIGDFHAGSNYITEEKLRRIVELANAQNPDLVVLLGDYVSQKREDKPMRERELKMPISTIVDNLRGLKAKYGVVAILGNQDFWFSDEKVDQELKRIGYKVLENEVFVIEKEDEKLRILGTPDQMKVKGNDWIGYKNKVGEALEKEEKKGDVIILNHSPDVVPLVTGKLSVSKDTKLFLAGHTHGGQVWFPFIGSPIVPSLYDQKYAFGHIKENNVDIFVTTGIGTSILPLRFLIPPEIAVLTIKSK